MTKHISRDDQLDAVVDEFTARLRQGQRPEIEHYLAEHPDLADELADVLSAVMMVEDVQSNSEETSLADETLQLSALGDYRIVREIGRGGMGVVYEAVEESLGRHVALKLLPSASMSRPDQLLRFRREARAAARLEHPHIVPVYGVGQSDGRHYIAMQYVVGHGVDRVIAELKSQQSAKLPGATEPPQRTSRPDATEDSASASRRIDSTMVLAGDSTASAAGSSEFYRNVARIAAEAAEALHYAHSEHVIHRDIKPSNLLLDVDGKTWVTDFGLAKLETDDNLTQTGDVVGTLRYMAPERLKGWADPTSDVYSLGLTLYEMVTLKPAFVASDRASLLDKVARDIPIAPRKVNDRIPRDLETIILKASARESAQRYQTAAAFAADLRRFQEGKPILARPTSWREQAWLWAKRNPAVASLTAGLMASLIIGLAAVSWNVYRLDQANSALTLRNQELKAANQKAEDSAKEAEARFRDALAAIDESLTRVADKRLDRLPGVEELRAELLNYALRFYREYIVSHEDDPQVQLGTANAWLRVAEITNVIGSIDDAKQAALEALSIAEQLHQDINTLDTAALLGKVKVHTGLIGAQTGETERATELYRESIALLRGVFAESQDKEDGQLLARALGQSAVLRRQQRQPEAAAALLQESIEIAESLLEADPEDTDTREVIAINYGNMANCLFNMRQTEEGLAALHRVQDLTEELLQEYPGDIGFQGLLKDTYSNEATIYARQGQLQRALPLAEKSVALSEGMHAVNPAVNELTADLAQQYSMLGSIYSGIDHPDARKLRAKALPLLEGLLKQNPEVLRFRLLLTGLRNDIATDMLKDDVKPQEVLERYDAALNMADAILENDPQNGQAAYLRSVISGGRAACLDKLERYHEALPAIEAAIEFPGPPGQRLNYQAKRAMILAHAGERSRAVEALEQLPQDQLPPDACCKAAATWACCAGLLADDASLSEADRTQQRELMVQQTIELLKRACAGGELATAEKRTRFLDRSDFDAIRETSVFQTALSELPAIATQPPDAL